MKAEKKQFSNRMGAAVLLLALACVNGYAQENKSSNDGSSKEEGNRNVMLNAASANGPREIQIGLPSADVNVCYQSAQRKLFVACRCQLEPCRIVENFRNCHYNR